MNDDAPYYGDRMFPEADEWFPEDETPEPDVMENIGDVYRIVDADNNVLHSNSNISGVYTDREWATNALNGHKGNRYRARWNKQPYRLQRAAVQWNEVED